MNSIAPKNRINLIVIQCITLSRAFAGIFFIVTALIDDLHIYALIFFIYACLTDLIDGFLAKRLDCTTKLGGILDLFSDKYLTIISSCYAIARGLPVIPCCLIILRETFLLSLRAIYIEGKPLFPPQRTLGAIIVIPIWGGTAILLLYPDTIEIPWNIFINYYWILGVATTTSLVFKIRKNWNLIISSFTMDNNS